jgi:hypothetical protein
MVFSDTTDRDGIVELLEDLTATQSTTTSSYTLKTKTRDINNAYSRYFLLGIEAEGRWQLDDTNHTKYPVITTNLVANQQDYSFTVDEQSNQILDIYRVEVLDSTGIARLLTPIDQFDVRGQALSEFLKTAALPTYYDKTANGIVLYPKPNYNSTNGIKIYFNRTPSYFVYTDTTKVPGIPDVFHEYLAIRPAYQYCLRKQLSQKNDLKADMLELEAFIKTYYSGRSKDEVKNMTPAYRNSR